jgi:hypothetical protein
MNNCNKTSDNKYLECPAVMEDGRAFTDYRQSDSVNEMIRNGNKVMTNFEYRNFLINNGKSIMKINNNYLEKKLECKDCNAPTVPFEKTCVYNINYSKCSDKNINGIGINNITDSSSDSSSNSISNSIKNESNLIEDFDCNIIGNKAYNKKCEKNAFKYKPCVDTGCATNVNGVNICCTSDCCDSESDSNSEYKYNPDIYHKKKYYKDDDDIYYNKKKYKKNFYKDDDDNYYIDNKDKPDYNNGIMLLIIILLSSILFFLIIYFLVKKFNIKNESKNYINKKIY